LRIDGVQHVHILSIYEISGWYNYNYNNNIRYARHDPAQPDNPKCLPIQRGGTGDPQAIETTSPSDEIHVLGARCFKAFPPYRNVKTGAAAATIVRVTQILVEVETGTRADDLIFRG
jgi:hypothetical protein